MDMAFAASASRPGRPTRAMAAVRQKELLDAAARLFLELGYDATTMEQIASAAGMTKRTIYSYHVDKGALFAATVQRAIEQMVGTQAETLARIADTDTETALRAIARMRTHQLADPASVLLQRLVNAEIRRFPEIFDSASAQITLPVVQALAAILRREARAGAIVTSDPQLAASTFLSSVAGAPSRLIAAGRTPDAADLEARADFCVALFLDGLRPRPEQNLGVDA
jgi:AcrR family transcriptional regulator